MKRLTTVTSVCVLALVLSLFIASVVSAQASSISTGVVTSVETGDDGGLTAFSIVGGDGGVLRFTVSSANPNTEFGLENRVGDRWVSELCSPALRSGSAHARCCCRRCSCHRYRHFFSQRSELQRLPRVETVGLLRSRGCNLRWLTTLFS